MIYSNITIHNTNRTQKVDESQNINEFLAFMGLVMAVYFTQVLSGEQNFEPVNILKGIGNTFDFFKQKREQRKQKQQEEKQRKEADKYLIYGKMFALMQKQKESGEELSEDDEDNYNIMCKSLYDEDGNMRNSDEIYDNIKSNFKKDDGSFDEETFDKFNKSQAEKYGKANKDGSIKKLSDAINKVSEEEAVNALNKGKEDAINAHKVDKQIEDEVRKAKEEGEKQKETLKNDLSEERIKQRTEERIAAIEKDANDSVVKADEEYDKVSEEYEKNWGKDDVGGEMNAKINEINNKLEAGNLGNDEREKLEAQKNQLESDKKEADNNLEKARSVRDTARENANKQKQGAKEQADKDIAEENKKIQNDLDNADENIKKSISEIKSPAHKKEVANSIKNTKSKEETPKDETPKDETPKDETPKDETPKDEPNEQTDDEKKEIYKKLLKDSGKTDDEISKILKDIDNYSGEDLDTAIEASAEDNKINLDDETSTEEGTEEEDDGKGGKSKTKFRKTKKKIGKGVKFERWSAKNNEWMPSTKQEYRDWKQRQAKKNESLSNFISKLLYS